MLPKKSVADILSDGSCYHPVSGKDRTGKNEDKTGYLSDDWEGTAKDIFAMTNIPVMDRLYVISRHGWLPETVSHKVASALREAIGTDGLQEAHIYTLGSHAEKSGIDVESIIDGVL